MMSQARTPALVLPVLLIGLIASGCISEDCKKDTKICCGLAADPCSSTWHECSVWINLPPYSLDWDGGEKCVPLSGKDATTQTSTGEHSGGLCSRGDLDALRTLVGSDLTLAMGAWRERATLEKLFAAGGGTNEPAPRLSRADLDRLDGFLDDLIEAAEPDLAMRLRALRAALDTASLVGATGPEAAERTAAAMRSTKILAAASTSPGPGQRGMAASGQAVVIPTAARLAGEAGTRWRTDVMVVNPGTVEATYRIALLVRGQANPEPATLLRKLAPGEGEFLGDVLDGLFDTSGAAALRITASVGAVAVTSRTYNLLGEGNELGLPAGSSFGQFVPALTADDAIPAGDAGDLIQLSHDPSLAAGSRTNLILVNASDTRATVEVDLYLDDGTKLGSFTTDLEAWEYDQVNRVFERVTQDAVAGGYAVVRPTTPGVRVFAMASVVDNLTGDPISVPASRRSVLSETTINETLTIPAAAHVRGAAGTNWRTDLAMANTARPPAFTTVQLLRRDQANTQPESETVVTMPGRSNRYDDVLDSLFATEGAAALRLSGAGIPVSSRTYNLLEAGNPQGLPAGATFGQYQAALPWSTGVVVGERAMLPHLSHDPTLKAGSRTNLILVNNANRASDIEVELFLADGSSLGSFTTTLEAFEYRQINRVFERVTQQVVDSGYAIVTTSSPWGFFHAQASVVDNLTGDPITVDAIATRRPKAAGVVTTFNSLFDVLAPSGLAPGGYFEILRAPDLETTIDAMASDLPGRFGRTPNGFSSDFGEGTEISSGVSVSGRLEMSLIDLDGSGGGLTGRVVLSLDGFAIDGRAPVVDGVALDLDLAQVDGDQVAGTVTLSSPAKAAGSDITGSLEFDTRICELYPVGGSITVTVGGEQRTISFSDRCDGGYEADIPSADFYRADFPARTCDGAWAGDHEQIYLIQEDGELAADPGAPAAYGSARWSAAGEVSSSDATVRFARSAAKSPDGSQLAGWLHVAKSSPGGGGVVYYTGPYGYDVSDGGCSASYYHGRDDPEFEPALLEPCDGPCAP